jgi:2-oxoglutarate ferredoxin oxidoreductase subunit alpha
VREIASKAKAIVFPELNLGQMVLEAERAVAGKIPVISVPHAGGTVHDPNVIVEKIMEAER